MEREVYRLREERTGVSLEGSPKPFARVREFTAVRLIEDGRLGSALAEGKDEEKALRLARETLRFSKEENYHLPAGCSARWDRTFEVDIEDLAGELSALANERGEKDLSLSGTVELITRRFSVESTAGADVDGAYSLVKVWLEVGGKVPFQLSGGSASWAGLRPLVEPYLNLVEGLEEVKPPKRSVEAILAPTPFYMLLLGAFLWKFRGSTEVRTGMGAKPGEVVASPLVTVVDDSLDEGALRYVRADDEGVKAGRNVLIDTGVARGLLWDSHTAWKVGRESTGNGIRMEDTVFDFFLFSSLAVHGGVQSSKD